MYLRSTVHSTSHSDAQLAVTNITSADFFKLKLKTWFPHIPYMADDLALWNINTTQTCWSQWLKYDDLIGYKNCSLNELLSVVMESFTPKHYQVLSRISSMAADASNTLLVSQNSYGIDRNKLSRYYWIKCLESQMTYF